MYKRQPLGSASLAQVHRATLLTGEDVAIKVQRPGAQQVMAQDIDIMPVSYTHLARSIRLDIPRFTLVGATTRSGMLTGPLLSLIHI